MHIILLFQAVGPEGVPKEFSGGQMASVYGGLICKQRISIDAILDY